MPPRAGNQTSLASGLSHRLQLHLGVDLRDHVEQQVVLDPQQVVLLGQGLLSPLQLLQVLGGEASRARSRLLRLPHSRLGI